MYGGCIFTSVTSFSADKTCVINLCTFLQDLKAANSSEGRKKKGKGKKTKAREIADEELDPRLP